ncbi:MAG: hypothetical protein ACTHM0_13420 [Sphingomonas sp.]
MTTGSSARERQRIAHLVLGEPRPRAPRRRRGRAPIALEPGIEEPVALREKWSHKAGTPETLEHAELARCRPGSLARLFATAAIDRDQLAAADAIAEAHRMITADVAIRTASLETRVDGGRHGRIEEEQLGRVRAELAYDWWRRSVAGPIDALLAVIVHDVGLTIVARRHGLSMPRARRLLTDALDLWWIGFGATRGEAIALAAET